ncbi:hypothetical protein [Niabella ginsengisoli]|uniref:Uncharacterized protein n=1 Tax=Niabella ginsengisoli TaxID=522298 RepID=A0ABS9SGK0_9BACT|nr:hypothetical protein [Niabella ginsengisoli]MCH5597491.1 hypothetical protein [Niabella ginsengisoli]
MESELIKRVLLDPADEKFMPTDGKTPLTKEETAIIKWWIETQAAAPDMKLAAAKPPAEILAGIQKVVGLSGAGEQAQSSEQPAVVLNTPAPKLQNNALDPFKKAGFVIKQISYNPDLLDVTLPSKKTCREMIK